MSNVDPNPANKGPNEGPNVPTEVGGLTTFSSGTFGSDENFGSLKYPKNINPKQERLFISQLKYVRTDLVQQESDFTQLKSLGYVTLPIPNDISETNSVGWGEDSLSNVARLAMPGLVTAASKGAVGEFTTAAQGGYDAAVSVLKGAGTRLSQYLATNAAASIVKKFGVNVNPESYISRATGAAINPNLELLFNGPKLRQFGFQFKMTPRDKDEAKEIRKILRFFKKGMSPKRSTDVQSSFFLGAPNVFKIQFLTGDNGSDLRSIGRIKTCALVSFSVNYTPDGFYSAYIDSDVGSQPIAVTMQLGFTELTPIFSDEYDGGVSDEVGPNNFSYTTPDVTTNSSSSSSGSGSLQGPTPSGRTLDEQQRIDAAIRAAGSTTPNIPGSAL